MALLDFHMKVKSLAVKVMMKCSDHRPRSQTLGGFFYKEAQSLSACSGLLCFETDIIHHMLQNCIVLSRSSNSRDWCFKVLRFFCKAPVVLPVVKMSGGIALFKRYHKRMNKCSEQLKGYDGCETIFWEIFILNWQKKIAGRSTRLK